MWNRQREAQEARERLALIGDDVAAPTRAPADDRLPASDAAE
jgi:ATP-binding cassette subfamily B protein